jgi:hypothetical protein
VLPFANLTGQPDQDYLVDGIVTELIAALTKNLRPVHHRRDVELRLQGPRSAIVRGRARTGRALCARRLDPAGRPNPAHLGAAGGGATARAIWSDRFTGSLDEIFELQDRLTESVAAAIEPTLRAAEAIRSRDKPQQDLRAYDLCLRVEPMLLFTAKPEEFRRAFALLDEAVARDPDYAYARALRVWAYTMAAGGRFISNAEAAHVLPDAYARSSIAERPTR